MPAGTAKSRAAKTDADETDVPMAPEPTDAEQEPEVPVVVEGQVADPTDVAPPKSLGALQNTFAAFKTTVLAQVDGKLDGKLKPIQQSIDDLAAMVSEIATNVPSAQAVTEEEDYFGDKLAEFRAELTAMADNRVTPNEFRDLVTTVQSLAGTVRDMAAGDWVAPAAPVPGVKAVYGQVLQLMKLVDEIGKTGKASYGTGADQAQYAFRGIDAAMNAVGSAMRQVGLIMRSEVLHQESSFYNVDKTNRQGEKYSETRWVTTKVIMRYIFVSPIDGSEHAVEGLGVGKDFGDKDGSKAASAAMKYALFQGLCIPVKGMNIDSESESADSGDPAYQDQAPSSEPYDDGPPADYSPDQTSAQPPAQAAKQDDRPEIERAFDAVMAAKTRGQLESLKSYAEDRGLLQTVVRGRPLISHFVAKRSTLPGGES